MGACGRCDGINTVPKVLIRACAVQCPRIDTLDNSLLSPSSCLGFMLSMTSFGCTSPGADVSSLQSPSSASVIKEESGFSPKRFR